jgi:hypothetical protein
MLLQGDATASRKNRNITDIFIFIFFLYMPATNINTKEISNIENY